MGFEHEGVEVWNQLVASLDGVTNEGSNFGVHPGFDHAADSVIVFVRFKTVDCEARGVDAELNPAEKEFWGGLRTFETANVVAVALEIVSTSYIMSMGVRRWKFTETYLKQAHSSIQSKRIGTLHTLPTGHVITTPRTGRIPHRSSSSRTSEDKGTIFGLEVNKSIMGRLAHEFAVKTASPKTNLVPNIFVVVSLSFESKLPLIVRNCILVVVIPNSFNANLAEAFYSIIPPFEANFRCEVDMATLSTLSTTCTPESGYTSFFRAWVGEECASSTEFLVFGVVGEDVGFYVGDDTNAFVMVVADEFGWVGETMAVPSKDVAGFWFGFGYGIARGELEGRAGNVISGNHSLVFVPHVLTFHPRNQVAKGLMVEERHDTLNGEVCRSK